MARPDAKELDDKYALERGRVVMTGIQALVRVPLDRARLDRALGLRTAGFISGYRGSPLAGFDTQLAAARSWLDPFDVVVRPGINEDLAATAVWGSQQVGLNPGARFDGVFGLWYGKTPGVDRTGDVFKHANFAGVSPRGGVVAIAGDDHGAKSSSIAAQSEFCFLDAEIPVFAPASVEEVLLFGVKAIAVSRFAGLWTAMTTVADIMDSVASFDIDPAHYAVGEPGGVALPPDGLHIRTPDTPLAQEVRHREFRLPAAQAFVRENGFDQLVFDAPRARLGLLGAGKAYAQLRQALVDLGIDDAAAARLGLRIYKPGMVWPLEPHGAKRFAQDLEEVLVIEERRDLVEAQLKQLCYGSPRAPRIVGKHDERGRPLLRSVGELDAAHVADAILSRIPDWQKTDAMRSYAARRVATPPPQDALHVRKPFFCSGCPHNTSTMVPQGSRAMAGIGCHYLVQTMPRSTATFTQMGGEGVSWVGQAPFTDERHVFVNLGDGTYFHSGILAIRQAVAARANITYKILFNDAVAMTGGQAVDGVLTPRRIAEQLVAEGVSRIVVVSDDPARTLLAGSFPAGVAVRSRDELDAVQLELRDVEGVSAMIYDQTCATELRRRRKRGLIEDPGVRPYINPRVCEGCGDCSVASNCVSIEPLETDFGQKRRVELSSCNSDLSCLKGFCPSFVTVRARPQKKAVQDISTELATLPEAKPAALGHTPYNIVLAGIGGQGVTSLAAILAMATHLDGGAVKSVDMLGMAQKGGGVFVQMRLAAEHADIPGPRLSPGQADVLLANDIVEAHGASVARLLSTERTRAVLNGVFTPTSDFTTQAGQVTFDVPGMRQRLEISSAELEVVAASRIATEHLGDAIYASVLLLGHLWQRGLIPVTLASLERAFELNGTAVSANKRALGLGRLVAARPDWALKAAAEDEAKPPEAFPAVLARLTDDLRSYQNASYARRFEEAIGKVHAVEQRLRPGADMLSLAAARSLHRLMAYKDEYEVARLYADPDFRRGLEAQFGPKPQLAISLAPPLIAPKDPVSGRPIKRLYGGWMIALMPTLARFKALRGTRLDPFGYTAERKMERGLRDEFLGVLDRICSPPDGVEFPLLVQLAELPQMVRGFGPVKEGNVVRYHTKLKMLLARLDGDGPADKSFVVAQRQEVTG